MQRAPGGAQVGCMRTHIITALLILALGATHAVAQTSRDSSRARAIDALPIGIQLKLVAAGHEYFGELTARNQLDLTLDRYGDQFTVPRMEVQALWIPEGRATRDGFFIGAIIGGVPGALLGWFAGGIMCESGCASNQAYGAIVGAGIGGLAVGGVGAVIGSAFTTWKRRFP
jgi:hypothetical protein